MVIKNLENKIKLVGIICTAFLVGCVIISVSSIWTARTMVTDAQKKVYVLDGNVPILVRRTTMEETLDVEAKSHVEMFHHYFFTLAPDDKYIRYTMEKAMYLVDETGLAQYKDIAIKHAMTTMHNHFRPDYTCWHVISYNNDGTVESKQTFQGKNDDSSWARGQAWAIYGYTACFRETNDSIFLNFAKDIANMIMDRVKTEDAIPYWDYDAPVTKETPRDVSAASVTASAMIELSTMVPDGQKYLDYAEKILKSLSSDAYLAKVGDNQGFILMHSVGSLPNGSEIDTPLNYADYYYLEALKRFMELKKLKVENGELRVIQ